MDTGGVLLPWKSSWRVLPNATTVNLFCMTRKSWPAGHQKIQTLTPSILKGKVSIDNTWLLFSSRCQHCKKFLVPFLRALARHLWEFPFVFAFYQSVLFDFLEYSCREVTRFPGFVTTSASRGIWLRRIGWWLGFNFLLLSRNPKIEIPSWTFPRTDRQEIFSCVRSDQNNDAPTFYRMTNSWTDWKSSST